MGVPESFIDPSAIKDNWYARVILPLAIPKPYSYWVPPDIRSETTIGKRVEVQFGRARRYTGIVIAVGPEDEIPFKLKSILTIMDEHPVVHPEHLAFWSWISDYYACYLGEVMQAALPSNLKLTSETFISLHPEYQEDTLILDDEEYLIAEALTIQKRLKLQDIQQILQKKTIYPTIQKLLQKQVIEIYEELKEKYRPKKEEVFTLNPEFNQNEDQAFNLVNRAPNQTEALLCFFQLVHGPEQIKKSALLAAGADATALRALVKKNILKSAQVLLSRIPSADLPPTPLPDLLPLQDEAVQAIRNSDLPVLLFGVTGSGKTRVYLELVKQTIGSGKQVLYLLPEIALTNHMISRIFNFFPRESLVFHSKLNDQERVEIWNNVRAGFPMVIGPRSALFLPFSNLGLIIVDEEHDPSYKQDDPAPRYHARDAAIVLAKSWQAKIILGSATPSFETYYNTQIGKYLRVELPERIGSSSLPEVQVIALSDYRKKKQLRKELSPNLFNAIENTLDHKKQVILFQNRRGFAPYQWCKQCAWHARCIHCDVSTTYHRFRHKLICHYCGFHTDLYKNCPDCGSSELELKGFGTEKIELDLKELFPAARIQRMDLDTANSVRAQEEILEEFAAQHIDILIGTQMVTKGLDFEHVALVGILLADQLFSFPDFRANERAYQLITQVSGRAGRREYPGLVILQAMKHEHPVLQDVTKHHFQSFYATEMADRRRFGYPPYTRLIAILLKHKKVDILIKAANRMARELVKYTGPNNLKGPTEPGVNRIRGLYLRQILLTFDKKSSKINEVKKYIHQLADQLRQEEGFSTLRVNIDVDPY